MTPLQSTLVFIVQVVFGLYILLVMLRFLLQWVQADFYNQISQVVLKSTQPVLRPMRRVIPAVGGLDTSSILLMLVLQCIELWLVAAILGIPASFGPLLLLAVGRLLELAIYVFMFAIIILAVLSFVQPASYHPAIGVLNSLASPLLRPLRSVIPPMGGLDLSPLVAIIALGVVLRLVVYTLISQAGLPPVM